MKFVIFSSEFLYVTDCVRKRRPSIPTGYEDVTDCKDQGNIYQV